MEIPYLVTPKAGRNRLTVHPFGAPATDNVERVLLGWRRHGSAVLVNVGERRRYGPGGSTEHAERAARDGGAEELPDERSREAGPPQEDRRVPA